MALYRKSEDVSKHIIYEGNYNPINREGKKMPYFYAKKFYMAANSDLTPLWQVEKALIPVDTNGIPMTNDGVGELDWNSVEWGMPKYPWECPNLSDTRYWPKTDGNWKQNNGWWEIHYSDNIKYVPMWPHKCQQLKLAKDTKPIIPKFLQDLGGWWINN